MKKLTVAQKFIKKSKEIMPHHDALIDLDENIDSADHIDEIMFRKSEYIGGMASVILTLIKDK